MLRLITQTIRGYLANVTRNVQNKYNHVIRNVTAGCYLLTLFAINEVHWNSIAN